LLGKYLIKSFLSFGHPPLTKEEAFFYLKDKTSPLVKGRYRFIRSEDLNTRKSFIYNYL